MIKILVSLLLVLAPALAGPHRGIAPHVVGGTEAPEGSYPFAVSFRFSSNKAFYCGGSLVSEQFVLTAAHCIKPAEDMMVGVGSVKLADQTLFEVDEAFVHPKYRPPNTENDIALVKLKKPVKISKNVQTIRFPYSNSMDDKNVTVMGWGRTSVVGPISPTLLFLKKPSLSNEECNKRFKGTGSKVSDGHLCLGSSLNSGVCFGDSGSPMLYEENNEKYLVGVLSWGLPCATGFPDVYSRVLYYADWVRETMKKAM